MYDAAVCGPVMSAGRRFREDVDEFLEGEVIRQEFEQLLLWRVKDVLRSAPFSSVVLNTWRSLFQILASRMDVPCLPTAGGPTNSRNMLQKCGRERSPKYTRRSSAVDTAIIPREVEENLRGFEGRG